MPRHSVVLLRASERFAYSVGGACSGTIAGARSGGSLNGARTEVKPHIEGRLVGYVSQLATLY